MDEQVPSVRRKIEHPFDQDLELKNLENSATSFVYILNTNTGAALQLVHSDEKDNYISWNSDNFPTEDLLLSNMKLQRKTVSA